MTTPLLPAPIQRYFEIERTHAFAAVGDCFARNAVVVDEHRSIEGLKAIEEWKRASQQKYQYTAEPLRCSGQDLKFSVDARVSGQFPGSPLELTYSFVLDGDLIRELRVK